MGLACFKSWKYDSAVRKGGNRDVPVSPGSYFFLSNSCGQGEEWLRTLNKGMWIPFTGVFGQRLEETVVYERRYGECMAPLVVEQCAAFIREHGLLEVELFLQPGQATLVKELQEAFDAGEKPSFDSGTDIHTVASLLKLYLRELPEPVVPFPCYQDFLLCGKHILVDRKQGLLELKRLLHELPVANFNLLHYICQFLNEVQVYSSSNKMSIQNLATVFGPNILRPKTEDPESNIGGAAVVQQLMSELIRECSLLFLRDGDPAAQPHCSCPASGPTNEVLPLDPPPSLPDGAGSPPNPPGIATPRPLETPSPESPVDPLYKNLLRSREQALLPPPTGPAAAEKGGPRPGGRGLANNTHKSTLSVYDNINAKRVPGPEGGMTSADSSIWSSSEVLVEHSLPSLRTNPEEPRFNSPTSSTPLSSGSSEVFLPSAPPPPQPSSNATLGLLTGLRQQTARQKLEYESQIKSLEQQNESLQVEVAGLRMNLEQQQRWHSVVEMKMRDAERARADANRRNAVLQQEMEQFFDTFGELSSEARKAEHIVQSF